MVQTTVGRIFLSAFCLMKPNHKINLSISMKRLTFICLFLVCFATFSVAQLVTPSFKVLAAFSSEELAAKSDDEMTILNITADHLCWFEEVKVENTSATYQLTDKNGNAVSLSDADLINFNPFMYSLPQDEMVCQNLIIVTSEGNKHLLVVRSETMMENKIQQEKKKLAKKKLSK